MRKLSLLATLLLFLCSDVFGQCTPTGFDCATFDETITRFQLESIDNSSGCSASGYTDYSYLPAPILAPGSQYQTTISVTAAGEENIGVYIDFDNSNSFEAAEKVVAFTTTQDGTFTNNFTVPLNASGGVTKLRVILNYVGETDPCGPTNNYGEAEDYSVEICSAGLNLTLAGDPTVNCEGLSETINISGNQAGKQVVRWEMSPNADFSANVTSIANTNWTLSTPVVNQDMYFRAVVRFNGGCEAPTSSTVFVDHVVTPKAPNISVVDDSTICPDASIQLFVVNDTAASPDTTYTWFDAFGTQLTGRAPTVTPFDTTFYTVRGEFGGCTGPVSIANINVLKRPALLVAGDTLDTAYVCRLDTLNLTIDEVIGGANYTWTPAAKMFANPADTFIQKFSSQKDTSEYVYVSISNHPQGCNITDSVWVITKPDAVVGNISSNYALACNGQDFQLTLNNNIGNPSWEYFNQLSGQWVAANDFDNYYQENVNVGNNEFRVVVNRNGCLDTTQVFTQAVKLVEPPKIGIRGDGFSFVNKEINTCENQKVEIYTIHDVDSISYTWASPSLNITKGQGTDSISILTNGAGTERLVLEVLDTTGCFARDSVEFISNAPGFAGSIEPIEDTLCSSSFYFAKATGFSGNLGWFYVENDGDYRKINGAGQDSVMVNISDFQPGLINISTKGLCKDTGMAYFPNKFPDLIKVKIASTDDFTVCEGNKIELTSNAVDNLLWSTGESSSSIFVDTLEFVSITYTDPNGCGITKDSVDITIIESVNQRLNWLASPDTVLCSGEEYNLINVITDEKTSNAFDIAWNGDGADNEKFYVVTESQSLFARINYEGCIFYTDTVNFFKPKPLPKPIIESVSNSFLSCDGDSIELKLSGEGFLFWGDDTTDVSLQKVIPATYDSIYRDTSVFAFNLDEYGCRVASNTVNLKFRNTPNKPVVVGSEPLFRMCEDGEVTLSTSSDGYWSTAMNNIDKELVVTQPGSYYFVANNGGCTSSSDTIEVVEIDLPDTLTIQRINGLEICEGELAKFRLNVNPSPEYVIEWNNDASLATKEIIVGNSSEIVAIVSDTAGVCSVRSAVYNLQVNPLPKKAELFSTSGDFKFCPNTSIQIYPDISGGYWNGNRGVVTQTFNVNTTRNVFYTTVNEFACEQNSDTILVEEIDLPSEILVENESDFKFCANESTILFVNNPQNLKVEWNEDASLNTDSIAVTDEGFYSVQLSDVEEKCKIVSDAVFVTHMAIPPKPIVRQIGDSLFTDQYLQINWFKVGEGEIAGASNRFYHPSESGVYFARYTNANGCYQDSEEFVYVISSIGESSILENVVVYPNPIESNKVLHVEGVNSGELILVDAVGKQFPLNKLTTKTWQLPNLAKGQYVLKLTSNSENKIVSKLIIK